MTRQDKPSIVVIGGGTGSGAVLTGLKDRANVTAVVNMADDGGSTGVLRRELGVLPGGDVWKCMAALSDDEKIRELFAYRFTDGELKGHSIGNILMAASEKVGGSFTRAIEMIAEIAQVNGRVLPVTVDDVHLRITWPNGASMDGEHVIDVALFDQDPRQAVLTLVPEAHPNPEAVSAIRTADIVVVAPGDLYTSLGSQLVIDSIGTALRETAAMKLYVANLITKPGHTDGFTAADHADEIERFAGGHCLDYVLYNTRAIAEVDGCKMVVADDEAVLQTKQYKMVPGNFLGAAVEQDASEVFSVAKRSAVRHDPLSVANAIMALYEQTNR